MAGVEVGAASKAELALTVGAAQNASFEMNKFACFMDTDPALLPGSLRCSRNAATGKMNIGFCVWHFTRE